MTVKESVTSPIPSRDELFWELEEYANLSSLISGFDDLAFPRWFGISFVELEMTKAERELMADFCRLVLLPDLVRDFERNRLKIAYALCFTDSRKLSAEVRSRLGLVTDAHTFCGEGDLPTLFSFDRRTAWATLCSSAENYLDRAYRSLSKGEHDALIQPFEFLGCLRGKNFDYICGLCFETTEFANGVVMIKGVWYFLRGPKRLVGEIKKIPEAKTERERTNLVGGRYNALSEEGLFVLPDCGGVWQPTRLFEPANTDQVRPLMDLL